MKLHWIDWAIIAAMFAGLTFAAVRTMRYTRSVSAFLAAERLGGRYIISVANAMAGLGVISLVWWFEQNFQVGYTSIWWQLMEGPVWILMAITGWVVYRFRQTRAMTLAQFFEMRYSRNFRVFAGIVAFVCGIVNFGIFPWVGAYFFIAICGFPMRFELAGMTIQTFPVIMIALLSISLAFTFMGGLIAVMVTDFLQGTFANIVFAMVNVYLIWYFGWHRMGETMLARPSGQSMVNPFDLGEESHFNFWYYMINIVVMFYGILAWQGAQGYNVCAKNPHEAKMAGILNQWRYKVLMLIVLVVPISVRTFLEHPDFVAERQVVETALASLDAPTQEQREYFQVRLRAPFVLAEVLPVGMLGLLVAALLACSISTYDTYLHSWGSILIQDVLLPFRKEPFTPRQHMWILRGAIFGVALFIFFFSLFHNPTQYVAMFLTLSGAIFVGGAGACIIGGLYWSRGTTAGAWAAMCTGIFMSAGGIIIKQMNPDFFVELLNSTDPQHADGNGAGALWHALARGMAYVKFHITGQVLTFYAIVGAVAMYVLVSLLTCRQPHNLDKLLHRGAYKVAGDESLSMDERRTWLEKLGFTKEFKGTDKAVAYVSLGWPLVWTVIFLIGTGYCLVRSARQEGWLRSEEADRMWLSFWHGYTWLILVCSLLITAWFAIGGFFDMRYLFQKLRTVRVDVTDDGRVKDPQKGRPTP